MPLDVPYSMERKGATGDSPMTKPPGQHCRQDRLLGHLLSSVLEDTQWTLNVSYPSQCPVWVTGVYCVFDIYFLRERQKYEGSICSKQKQKNAWNNSQKQTIHWWDYLKNKHHIFYYVFEVKKRFNDVKKFYLKPEVHSETSENCQLFQISIWVFNPEKRTQHSVMTMTGVEM